MTDKSRAQIKKEPEKAKEEPSSMFQRQRVDMLLGELMRKFPLPMMTNPNAPPPPPPPPPPPSAGAVGTSTSTDQTAIHPQRPDLKENTTTNNNNSQNGEFKPPEKRAK